MLQEKNSCKIKNTFARKYNPNGRLLFGNVEQGVADCSMQFSTRH